MLDSRWLHTLLVAAAFLGAIVYLGQAAYAGFLGFPLDDSWIHQTYARNLAQWGQLAYVRGQLSAGSTAPLWTMVLSVGYLLRVDGRLWAYMAGAICLVLTANTVSHLARLLWPDRQWTAFAAAVFCVLEWHLIWAAFSGMETLLFTCLSLLLIEQSLAGGRPFLIGLLGALLVLTRPEGVVLLLLVAVITWLPDERRPARPVDITALLAGFTLLVVPYLTYNVIISGKLFPSTFYAKQGEYRALLTGLPLWARLWGVTRPTLVGAQVFLLPGFVYAVLRVVKAAIAGRRDLAPRELLFSILPLVWWASLLMMYALRLPVDYHHGRYVIPTIPVLILYGVSGMAEILRPFSSRSVVRVASRVFLGATLVLLLAFVVVGGGAYAQDVNFIECEMVDTAHWLAANTPPDALIATHDIGAIGYFSEHPLLDMAGLITPQVIPFIHDEPRLLAFIQGNRADYLVTFPSWYPQIVQNPCLVPVYCTECPWTESMGHDNMVVYRLCSPE
jgi:arabinofuranosyltransferase